MAPTVRRKRLEKTEEPQPQSTGTQKFICCRCGTAFSRLKGYFPVSHSPMYRGTGYLPFCSDCVDDLYDQYSKKLGSERAAMRRMCMKMDLYWSDSIFDMVERTSGVQSKARNYIGKTNIIRYIDKTFDDTLEEEARSGIQPDMQIAASAIRNAAEKEEVESEPVDPALVDFWGEGFQSSFYVDLAKRYEDWTKGEEITDPGKRSLYKHICILEATIARDSAHGKAVDKNINTLNSLLGSMNLKPAQQKETMDAELEHMPLGVGIQKWEYSRPIPETPKELKDSSGLIKNITTWFLGHAAKMVGLKNGYVKLYEDAMNELRVKNPEYEQEEDDEVLDGLFGGYDGENGA